MKSDELNEWYRRYRETLEDAYLGHEEPWKQSGFSGPAERWNALRMPVALCMERSGSFLDIGCANGYLLECVMKWCGERDVEIAPYGLDMSPPLLALARQRLPRYADNLHIGNALSWSPPRRFDYVRTELLYVPEEYRARFLGRLLEEFLLDDGRLLVAEYLRRDHPADAPTLLEQVAELGFEADGMVEGTYEGMTLTRVAVLQR